MSFVLSCGCHCVDEQTVVPCCSDKCVYNDDEVKERFEKEKEMDTFNKEAEKDMMDEINPWIN